jgi:hypothetical protein
MSKQFDVELASNLEEDDVSVETSEVVINYLKLLSLMEEWADTEWLGCDFSE